MTGAEALAGVRDGDLLWTCAPRPEELAEQLARRPDLAQRAKAWLHRRYADCCGIVEHRLADIEPPARQLLEHGTRSGTDVMPLTTAHPDG